MKKILSLFLAAALAASLSAQNVNIQKTPAKPVGAGANNLTAPSKVIVVPSGGSITATGSGIISATTITGSSGVSAGSYTNANITVTAAGLVTAASNGTGTGTGFATQINVRDYGATGDGTTDDTAAIQAAMTAANTVGVTEIVFPAGTYAIIPATLVTDEVNPTPPGTNYAAFVLKSHQHLKGYGNPTIKVKNSVSTSGSPKRMTMFFTNEVLSDISFRDLTLDMNGANNLISPSRPTTYAQYEQAHIMVSGTPSGVAARIDDVIIDGCQFLNTAGVSCIVMAQSNTTSVTLGHRWTITNSLFKNNGLDTDDHSSIFGWAEDVLIQGNTFTADTPYHTTGKTGSVVAHEVHGANHRFTENFIKNYYRGLWVGPNLTSAATNTIIANNTIMAAFYGVDFFRSAANQSAVTDTLIEGNTFTFDNYTFTGAPDQKAAVNIASAYGISRVTIANNIATNTGTTTSTAFAVATPTTVAGQTHTGIYVSGNSVYAFSNGGYFRGNGVNGLGYISVTDNEFVNFQPLGGSASVGIYDDGATATTNLILTGNRLVDTRSTSLFSYGIVLNGLITKLTVGSNTYQNLLTTNYDASGATVATAVPLVFNGAINLGTNIIPVANLGTGTPTGLKFLRDDGVFAVPAGSGGGVWGTITGTLGEQSDLAAALDLKENWADNRVAMAALVMSTTKNVLNTKTFTGSSATVQFFSTPVAGDVIEAEFTAPNAVFQLLYPTTGSPTFYSIASGGLRNGCVLAANSITKLRFSCISAGVFTIEGDPYGISDLTPNASPLLTDQFALYKASNGATGSVTLTALRALFNESPVFSGDVSAGQNVDANNFLYAGTRTAASGLGGNVRLRDDTGTFRWVAGMLGGAAETTYSIWDQVAGARRLTINSTGIVAMPVYGAGIATFDGSGVISSTAIIPLANGGTGAATAAGALVNLTVAAVTAGGTAINWSASPSHSRTLSANTTFTFASAADGQTIVVAVTNTSGNYTVTWPTVSWSGGTAPTQTIGAKTDIYTFIKIGSTIYGSAVQNF